MKTTPAQDVVDSYRNGADPILKQTALRFNGKEVSERSQKAYSGYIARDAKTNRVVKLVNEAFCNFVDKKDGSELPDEVKALGLDPSAC